MKCFEPIRTKFLDRALGKMMVIIILISQQLSGFYFIYVKIVVNFYWVIMTVIILMTGIFSGFLFKLHKIIDNHFVISLNDSTITTSCLDMTSLVVMTSITDSPVIRVVETTIMKEFV